MLSVSFEIVLRQKIELIEVLNRFRHDNPNKNYRSQKKVVALQEIQLHPEKKDPLIAKVRMYIMFCRLLSALSRTGILSRHNLIMPSFSVFFSALQSLPFDNYVEDLQVEHCFPNSQWLRQKEVSQIC